jgi:antirestriction protein ArdC
MVSRAIESVENTHPIKIVFTRRINPVYLYFCYRATDTEVFDKIWFPVPSRYRSNKSYYNDLIHELSHAACSRNRLNLKFSQPYEEEISVESVALVMMLLFGFNTWKDDIRYIRRHSYKKSSHSKDLRMTSKKQWNDVKKKSKRILKYLLSGKMKIK